jgi:hypothetical protein
LIRAKLNRSAWLVALDRLTGALARGAMSQEVEVSRAARRAGGSAKRGAGLRGAARGHVRVVGQALASGSASSCAAVERHYIAEGRCSMSMEGGFFCGAGAKGTGRSRYLKRSVCAAETGSRRLYGGGNSGWWLASSAPAARLLVGCSPVIAQRSRTEPALRTADRFGHERNRAMSRRRLGEPIEDGPDGRGPCHCSKAPAL